MTGQNDENLKDLFERFSDADAAAEAASEITAGDRLFRDNPAPAPDASLVADIKQQINARLAEPPRVNSWAALRKVAAVAAVFFVAAVIGVKVFDRGHTQVEKSVVAEATDAVFWESDDVDGDDAELAMFAAEIEQISAELLALESGENAANGYETLSEIETELLEINSEFWTG